MSDTGGREAKRELTATLNHLIETCKDVEKGYRDTASDIHDSELKSLFGKYSHERAQFSRALQQAVRQAGGFAKTNGTVGGALRRGWLELKSTLDGGDERLMLTECAHNEDVGKANYEAALRRTLPAAVKRLLEHQYAAIADAQREMHRLCGAP